MRFLLGLLLGVAVVLAGAEGLSDDGRARLSALADYARHKAAALARAAPPSPAPRPVTAAAADGAEPAGHPIPRPPDPRRPETERTADVRTPAEPDASSAAATASAEAVLAVEDSPVGPSPADSSPPGPSPVSPSPLRGAMADADTAETAIPGAGTADAEVADAGMPDIERIRTDPDTSAIAAPARRPQSDAPASGQPASQPVWVPFHSEMSAAGFAQRLSDSVEHPFRVERRGPGRYQVVFAYADEPQRRRLLDRAAAATGLPL